MKFYSGYALENDQTLFTEYLKESQYCVAGFSYGAIKAFEYTLGSTERIDTLQLFSPAFFQSKDEKFKRLQMMGHKKSATSYFKSFFSSCFAPAGIDENVKCIGGSAEELQELLYYTWENEKLRNLLDRGIEIEIYLGSEDKIIDTEATKEFFLPYATTYLVNGAGHTLQKIQRRNYE